MTSPVVIFAGTAYMVVRCLHIMASRRGLSCKRNKPTGEVERYHQRQYITLSDKHNTVLQTKYSDTALPPMSRCHGVASKPNMKHETRNSAALSPVRRPTGNLPARHLHAETDLHCPLSSSGKR